MAKLTQIKRISTALARDGYVSRNEYLDMPTDKVLRLADIVSKLRKQGWSITTDDDGKDCVYRAVPKEVKSYYVLFLDGTKELRQENVWH